MQAGALVLSISDKNMESGRRESKYNGNFILINA